MHWYGSRSEKVYNPGENEVRALTAHSEIHARNLWLLSDSLGSGNPPLYEHAGLSGCPHFGKYYLNGTDVSTMKDK